MKQTRFEVKYKNGVEKTIYSRGVVSAWAKAFYYATTEGKDGAIESITDEYGTKYTHFIFDYATELA